MTNSIKDSRLDNKNILSYQERIDIANQEHENQIDNNKLKEITRQTYYTRKASIWIIVLLIVLIAGLIGLLLYDPFPENTGMGYTLGIISTVIGLIIRDLISKVWDFKDINQF